VFGAIGEPFDIETAKSVFDTNVFEGNVWGLEWYDRSLGDSEITPKGFFPQYFKDVGDKRVAVAAADVPAETGLLTQEFKLAERGEPFTSPDAGAWNCPGPELGPFTITLADGSLVSYSWYRFIDRPSFQQYD